MASMTTLRSGRLTDLRGECVSFTGWLTSARKDYIRRVRRCGARHQKHVSGSVTVMVQGMPNTQYKWGSMGTKLKEISELQQWGYRIFLISESELIRLLDGESLTMAESRAAQASASSPVGVTYRRSTLRPSADKSRRLPCIAVDLDAQERRTATHRQLVNGLADWVAETGRLPLSPVQRDCLFDVGWSVGATFHVAKIKTITDGNESQQMRLGLGQLLDYRHTLLKDRNRVVAHLVLSCEPSDDHMVEVCNAHRVRVSWPPDFECAD